MPRNPAQQGRESDKPPTAVCMYVLPAGAYIEWLTWISSLMMKRSHDAATCGNLRQLQGRYMTRSASKYLLEVGYSFNPCACFRRSCRVEPQVLHETRNKQGRELE